jgi:uncharacterized protein YxjI
MNFKFIILGLLLFSIAAFSQNSIHRNRKLFIITEKNASYIADDDDKKMTIRYDSIIDNRVYLLCYSKNNISVLTQDSLKTVLKNIRAIHQVPRTNFTFQFLKNNKIFWINDKFKIFDEDPNEYFPRYVCGTVNSTSNRIEIKDSSTFFLQVTRDETGKIIEDFEVDISSLVGTNKITFLNNSEYLEFDGNSEFPNGFDNLTFFEKTNTGTYNIIKLTISKNKLDKLILVDNINQFHISTFLKPFIYKKGKQYGFYPMSSAKYQFIMPLNPNFARFVLPNGKYGWLDKQGREYIDE